MSNYRHVGRGEAGGAYAPPDFGRSKSAAGQLRHVASGPYISIYSGEIERE